MVVMMMMMMMVVIHEMLRTERYHPFRTRSHYYEAPINHHEPKYVVRAANYETSFCWSNWLEPITGKFVSH
jgi:hypothetical protein